MLAFSREIETCGPRGADLCLQEAPIRQLQENTVVYCVTHTSIPCADVPTGGIGN